MTARREIPLCHYRYDPLDQLISCAMSAQTNTQRFYLKDRLANEVQGAVQRSIMQHGDQLLAEQRCEGGPLETTILATDQQRSVLTILDSTRPHLSLTHPMVTVFRKTACSACSASAANGQIQLRGAICWEMVIGRLIQC